MNLINYVIGIDMGGTKVNTALTQGSKIIKKISFSSETGKSAFIKNLIKSIEEVTFGIKMSQVKGIGLGIPGPADYHNGIIKNSPNIKRFTKLDLKTPLVKRFKKKVILDNDANVVALAERKYGIGRKYMNFIVLTLGTGIGSGAIIDGKLYHGHGQATEIGHMSINFDDRKSQCGNIGCIETYASGKAITKNSLKVFGRKIRATELAKMARRGNKKAARILNNSGMFLGIAFANIVNIFDPEIIILAGGVREAGNALLNSAKKEMKKRAIIKTPKIVWSKLADPAVLGAAALLDDV